jgi:hypothetical protein
MRALKPGSALERMRLKRSTGWMKFNKYNMTSKISDVKFMLAMVMIMELPLLTLILTDRVATVVRSHLWAGRSNHNLSPVKCVSYISEIFPGIIIMPLLLPICCSVVTANVF